MARQASEIRPAVPFSGLGAFEDALDGFRLEATSGSDTTAPDDARTIQLSRERFLAADYRLVLDSDAVAAAVARGVRGSLLPEDVVSLLCFATSVTLKQTQLVHPRRDGGRVLLAALGASSPPPAEISIDPSSNPRLFHDVGSGFRVTYGFVLARSVETDDPLKPKWKGTWLARRVQRVQVVKERIGSYEIHELTEERRVEFGLRGRPLYYVRQADEAVSPLIADHLDEVVEIYVDADVLPLLRSERPGAATRYVASQIAVQLYLMVLELGARDLDDDGPEPGCVFSKALSFLRRRDDAPDVEQIRRWVETDPGRLSAWVQAKVGQVETAEALLAS